MTMRAVDVALPGRESVPAAEVDDSHFCVNGTCGDDGGPNPHRRRPSPDDHKTPTHPRRPQCSGQRVVLRTGKADHRYTCWVTDMFGSLLVRGHNEVM